MKKFLLIPVSLLLFSACTSGRAKYQVNVGNGNEQLPVRNVTLLIDGEKRREFTMIAPAKVAVDKPLKGELPTTITVSWKDAKGNSYSETVKLDVTTRPDFTGQLVLEITKENNLTLTEVTTNEQEFGNIPWNEPASWEGSVSLPGMDDI